MLWGRCLLPIWSAPLSEGMLHMSSTNGQACPYLVSRLPGGVPLFPAMGDFTLTVRMRFDHVTPWGTFFVVLQSQSSEPSGSAPLGQYEDVLMAISAANLTSGLSGQYITFGMLASPTELHEFSLECVGTIYTIRVDGQVAYGPIASTLRPTCVYMGNQVLAYWYPTDWCYLSMDDIRVEVPGPVPVGTTSWGSIKAMYR